MPQIIFLPHEQRCPEGAVFDAEPGDNLIELALENGVDIEHAPVRPATLFSGKDLIHWMNPTRRKMICSTWHGVLSRIRG